MEGHKAAVCHQGAVRQGLLKESSRPRCSIARGLTVINESLNVGKHFISASSVFIRPGQPLAGQERAVTFITTTQKAEGERPPIGLIKTPAPRHDTSYSLLLPRHTAVINYTILCPSKLISAFNLRCCLNLTVRTSVQAVHRLAIEYTFAFITVLLAAPQEMCF